MESWRSELRIDPIPALLASEDQALQHFVNGDLLNEDPHPIEHIWALPEVQNILKKQVDDGSWDRPAGQKKYKAINYKLIDTWKQFRFLIDQFAFTRDHPAIEKAAEFLFSCQTELGDIRGMLANQYANYYTGAILSLLIKAGYEDDPRVEKGMQWLISHRQDDLGWSEALITHKFDRETLLRLTSQYAEPIETDRSKPFSHNSTGMVLRAFATHSRYRASEAARIAAKLQKSRFFQPDRYTSYHSADYWLRFQFPFWWNNLVAALDSISQIDPSRDEKIEDALRWLIEHQEKDGLWMTSYGSGEERENTKTRETRLWVTLAICRVFKRVF